MSKRTPPKKGPARKPPGTKKAAPGARAAGARPAGGGPRAGQAQRRAASPPSRRSPVLWAVLAALVVLLGIVAVVATRGGDGGDDTASGLSQTREVAVSGGSLPPLAKSGPDAAAGATIPTVNGRSFDGTPVSIAPGGGAKVISFVAHWCPHCQAEVPRIVEHLKTNPDLSGVSLLGVSTGVDDNRPNYPPSEWLTDEGWTIPTLADDTGSSAASAFGLSSYPFFVAVDANGRVVQRAEGELSMEQFDALVTAARTGRTA